MKVYSYREDVNSELEITDQPKEYGSEPVEIEIPKETFERWKQLREELAQIESQVWSLRTGIDRNDPLASRLEQITYFGFDDIGHFVQIGTDIQYRTQTQWYWLIQEKGRASRAEH
jgi:hypothetical protein